MTRALSEIQKPVAICIVEEESGDHEADDNRRREMVILKTSH